MWKRKDDVSEHDLRLRQAHESEMGKMLLEMIQHEEDLPGSFADGNYEQACIDYQRAKARWEMEEPKATPEKEENRMAQQKPSGWAKEPIEDPPSYCVGMTWNSRLNPESIAIPIAVSKQVEAMEDYLTTIRGFRPDQRCVMQIGEAQYEAFDEAGYSLILYQGIWVTQKDLGRFQERQVGDTEWWHGVQGALVELEDRLSSYPKDDLPYGKDCLPMLQGVIDKIPLWAVRTSEKDALLSFLRC